MASLGLHPRLAHLALVAQSLGAPELGCLVASLLTERDVFRGRSVFIGSRVRV